MNISEAKEKILSLYKKSLYVKVGDCRQHPIRIVQAVKSIIGINVDEPIVDLLSFCENYIQSFEITKSNYSDDVTSVPEMVSYKNLEEALIKKDIVDSKSKICDLFKVSEGMQILEFLLEFSFKYSNKSFLLVWSIYRLVLFSDRKFMLKSLIICVDCILATNDVFAINKNNSDPIKDLNILSLEEFDNYSVLHSIYNSNLVRRKKISNYMSKHIIFDLGISYNGDYLNRIKLWHYIKEKKYDDLNCDLLLDLDATRSMMKEVEDRSLNPLKIYNYSKKYIL